MGARSLLVAVATSAIAGVLLIPGPRFAEAAPATSRFVPTQPCRLADVRTGLGFERHDDRIVRVVVSGKCGVPADATAVALTVTVDNTGVAGPGFVTIWPEGAPMPTASILNYRAGQIRANATIVAVGIGGAIDLFSQNSAPVIVDVTGWFTASVTSTAGRFVPITPTRAADTRQPPRAAPMAAGERVNVPLPPSVPADAAAVALTVTLTESSGSGFFTVFPAGTAFPPTSTINADGRGQTRAAGAIVAVTPQGLDVYSHAGGHVIVDITGWFTGASATEDDDGLFVAETAPRRLIDTRSGDPVWPGGTVGINNVSTDAAALVLNVTIVNPHRPGFLTAAPARQPRPPTSTVNGGSSTDIAAAMAIVPTTGAGVDVYSNAGADLVADVSGWFVGSPGATALPPPTNVRPPECATSTDPAGLEAFFANNALLAGADYQRVFPLPDGRALWLFQDVYFRGRGGQTTFAHNAGLVQSGACFTLLQTGNYARPRELLFPDQTQTQRHWFWPLAGDVGVDGRFHLFVAELRENSAPYLTFVEPLATWKVAIDLPSMQVVDRRPAVDSSTSLYGWSVESTPEYTYLFAHCHRQFGWDPFPFVSPPVYVHDVDCAPRMTVARVPTGRFDVPMTYWNGAAWVPDPLQAVNIAPSGRASSASQVYLVGDRWVSVTKDWDWFGTAITIDTAPRPEGPYTTVRTIATPAKCSTCNTYFPSLMPFAASDGSWIVGLSNNVFGPIDMARYHPTFFALAPV